MLKVPLIVLDLLLQLLLQLLLRMCMPAWLQACKSAWLKHCCSAAVHTLRHKGETGAALPILLSCNMPAAAQAPTIAPAAALGWMQLENNSTAAVQGPCHPQARSCCWWRLTVSVKQTNKGKQRSQQLERARWSEMAHYKQRSNAAACFDGTVRGTKHPLPQCC
jgi:hypothetical protein